MPPNTAGLCGIQITPASPVRTIQGMKKALRTCYLQRVRPAQHKPVGRDALFLRRKGFRGNQAHANAWAFSILKGLAR